MKVFIQATSAISPQQSYESEGYLNEIKAREGAHFSCIEPEYRTVIDPKLLRRMSRIIRMGVASSIKCLEYAALAKPGAIIVGTGLGCLADTEKFLTGIVGKDSVLSPTPFIQSTHNTIGGQISLMLQCHAYNYTYVQRGHSFENALQDALMLLDEGTDNILIGGIDEATPTSIQVISKIDCGEKTSNHQDQIGEGAAFFLLSSKVNANSYAVISAFQTVYGACKADEINAWIREILESKNLKPNEVDALMLGENGNVENDDIYKTIRGQLFSGTPAFAFKKLCGEYFTSISFGLNLAANMIKNQHGYGIGPMPINNVLIYNHYKNKYHSIILLRKCQGSIS